MGIISFRNSLNGIIYTKFLKPIFFLFDPEFVHNSFEKKGAILGSNPLTRKITSLLFNYRNPILNQNIEGINFQSPVGLSAGFDYEAKLTQILPSLAFGFQTIGTITNMPYEGNPSPRLGRLPKSRSLMVNKGFKNPGADSIIKSLGSKKFNIPVGISIGRTNSPKLKTQKESVRDIIKSFKKFENSMLPFSYYELNISCPNIIHASNIEFYSSKNLSALLKEIENLRIAKPIFIKMPINETNKETLRMLKVISKFSIKGVIFGNLNKNRNDSSLNQSEVRKFKVGNFSGKPTEKRSNELISLAYKNYK